jgi:hypothetical protein
MSTDALPGRHATLAERVARHVPPALVVLALAHLVPAAWMLVAPHGFFHQLGPFGVYNGHYLRDAAAFEGGIGIALAVAIAWPVLRAGALAAALAATTLHAINHWVDVGAAHAGSNAGIGDAVSLTVLALATGGLLAVTLAPRPAR